MSCECKNLHQIANSLERHKFPFDSDDIPRNGVYFLFQRGETSHQVDRVVRVGTHTGDNQLQSRLKQHFNQENKDRSIFRKNIGRALLSKNSDAFLKLWDLDLTTRKAKDEYGPLIDFDYQKAIEHQVSLYIRENFTFSTFPIASKDERLNIESKLISTLSWCEECKPSSDWLGNYSPKNKIVQSGLWLVNELYKTPMTADEANNLSEKIKGYSIHKG